MKRGWSARQSRPDSAPLDPAGCLPASNSAPVGPTGRKTKPPTWVGRLAIPMAVSTEERRIVTVLFADMAGSTALGEQLDPEEMRSVLARYYAIARECVETHGGTVEKFIGDAGMAGFGLPIAHRDDPDPAVAAALRIPARIQGDPLPRDPVGIPVGARTRQ